MRLMILTATIFLATLFLASCADQATQNAASSPAAASPAAAPAMAEADVVKALTKLEDDGAKSMVENDPTYVEKVMSDNWVWTMANGEEATKASLLADMKSGKFKFTEAKASDIKVKVYGNSAIVTGTMSTKGTYDKHDIGGSERFTDTYVSMGGKWMLVATHNSPAPKPAPKKM